MSIWDKFSTFSTPSKAGIIVVAVIIVAGIIAVIVLAATGHFSSSSASIISVTPLFPSVVPSTVDPPMFVPCTTDKCFNVGNTCPFPIWIHSVNNPAPPETKVVLMPDLERLAPGEAKQYEVPDEWSAGRVNAYYKDPSVPANATAFDKVEMTVLSNGSMNYDITYVDYLALPSRITAGPDATNCTPSDSEVTCNVSVEQVLQRCPQGADFNLLDPTDNRCLSAGLYCSDTNNVDKSFCKLLDSQIAKCVGDPETYPMCADAKDNGNTTPDVYACQKYFSTGPPPDSNVGNQWCAALNRNTLDDPKNPDATFYEGTAINQYAKWVHETCPGIYAFPYDDFLSQGGDRSCTTNRLDILFCPGNANE